jgi:hypothetical protein
MFNSLKRTLNKFNPFAQAKAAAYFEKAYLEAELQLAESEVRLTDLRWELQIQSLVAKGCSLESAAWQCAGSSYEEDSEAATRFHDELSDAYYSRYY